MSESETTNENPVPAESQVRILLRSAQSGAHFNPTLGRRLCEAVLALQERARDLATRVRIDQRALRDAEAVLARYVYPKPDVPEDHPYAVLRRVREAIRDDPDGPWAPGWERRVQGVCTWHRPDPEDEVYETACDTEFTSPEGMRLDELPTMNYCANCGRPIHVVAPEDNQE